MEMGALLDLLVQMLPKAVVVLQVLGSLVVIATAYVAVTPSQDDDAAAAKIRAIPIVGALMVALERFSIIGRR